MNVHVGGVPGEKTSLSWVSRARQVMSTGRDTVQLRLGQNSAAMPGARTAVTVAALAVTLGLAAGCWVVAVRRMGGMDMGVATRLGSFAFFIAVWVPMMAAMMLPGAAPAVVRHAQADIDVPLALAITGLGILIILAPALVPGLTPPM